MKKLKDLICKADDTLEEIWFYAEQATLLKESDRSLADTYIKIAEMHITIYNMLHEKMVTLINEEKAKGTTIPKVMFEIWEYDHSRLIKEFSMAKILIDEFKNKY